MALELRQSLQLSQQLRMTPQLQQAIKLLQLSRMELVDVVREEMEENFLLEESDLAPGDKEADGEKPKEGDEPASVDMSMEGIDTERSNEPQPSTETKEVKADESAVNEMDWEAYLEQHSMTPAAPVIRNRNDDDMPSIEATLTRRPSIYDHLAWQLQMSDLKGRDEAIATLIIGNINAAGYFEGSLEDIANEADVRIDRAESVLKRVQEYDPVGVGARDLRECLLIQARYHGEDDEVLVGMITNHMGNLERKNYAAIATDLNQPLDEIYEAVKVIARFEPKPGRLYSDDEPVYITPDVYVHKVGEEYFVVSNDDGLPKLKISNFYRTAMSGGSKERQYVQDKLRSAQWLIRSIQQRQRTIIRVTESIVKFQREFFDKGINFLKPLILRDVAEDIQMHESTISRVTTNKYVHTPQGIFELKYFFNSGINRTEGEDIASESVKRRIKEIIAKENVKKPLSDQKLVDMLRSQDIDIARRTVAKYREQLGILSSSKRKQVF